MPHHRKVQSNLLPDHFKNTVTDFARTLQDAAKRVDEHLRPIAQIASQFRTSLNSLFLADRGWAKALKEMQDTIEAHLAFIDQFNVTLYDHGWPPPLAIGTDDAYEIFFEINKKSLTKDQRKDILASKLCEFHTGPVLEEMLVNWKSKAFLSKRIHILEAGVKAHLRGEYCLSVTGLIPQVEGIVVDVFQRSARVSIGKIKSILSEVVSKERPGDMNSITARLIMNAFLKSFQPGTSPDFDLNRNAILHGVTVDYGTEATSIKAIMLLDNLVHSAEDFAQATSGSGTKGAKHR